jgi:hypothetical protein
MATVGNITAHGKSGTPYPFRLYSLDTRFKAIGGIYIFLCGQTPVYCGQTGDLSTRFDGHHKAAEISLHRADCIGVLVEEDEDRRLAIERDLLENYMWPCNSY